MRALIDLTTDAMRGKVGRLIDFLARVARLRARITRDVNEYQKVLWMADVPRLKGCFAQAWGRDENYDSDVWLDVEGRREPELPRVPDDCAEWVDKSSLRAKGDLPTLLPEITRQLGNPEWSDGSEQPEFVAVRTSLDEYPNVRKEWARYVEERWFPWREEHNAWEKVHRVYSSLFAIHQEQIRLGEEYELVVGLGLLNWQTPSGQRVRRHLVVADAIVDFEARLKRFVVRPHPEGARLRPELDMLDVQDQPPHAETAANAALANGGDDPWEANCVEGVLQALVHSINSQGEYRQALEAMSGAPTSKPVVHLAPALILRKRSDKGLFETLRRIKEKIEADGSIPREFSDVAEIGDPRDADGESEFEQGTTTYDGEVFFPKPSNADQRRIVDKLRAANGVLVQGPPGTGKSHTIANLICHLLATGQRILVTAKTPRALQVLEGLLPVEVRPLCINLLGSGLEEKRALESSVGGIIGKHATWREERASAHRNELAAALSRLREEKNAIERRLRTIHEAETHSHSIAGGAYYGTAARIAEAVSRDSAANEWFTDVVPLRDACPFGPAELSAIMASLRRFTDDKRRELALEWVEPPSAERIADLFATEASADQDHRAWLDSADERVADILARSEMGAIVAVHESLLAFRDAQKRLTALPHSWMADATRDAIGDNTALWRELWRATKSTIHAAEHLASIADDTAVGLPDGISAKAILDDTVALKKHLEAGGGLGWWLFRPKPIKDRLYLIKQVRVNGRMCRNATDFGMLADVMRVRLECEKAWNNWAGKAERHSGPYSLQISALKSLCEALENALALEQLIEGCASEIRKCPAIDLPRWENIDKVEKLIASCRLALARQRQQQAKSEFEKMRSPLAMCASRPGAHPVVVDLVRAIDNRNVQAVGAAVLDLNRLTTELAGLRQLDADSARVARVLPELMDELRRTREDPSWDDRFSLLAAAWQWAQAKYWVEEYLKTDDLPALTKRVRQIDDDIHAKTATLASLHAWSFCYSRLTEEHRRHMEAWQQSMRRLGKGTGKHASRHRRDAQAHLNKCREAVPAWVMPLHRVWDTVDPAPGMFDVIIVDEASQCGLEALPLLYLGKKILIVGDDKQISPDAVGLDRASIHHLMEEHLADFQFKSSFDVESSLFDQGKLRYGTRQITLREHFRCMPEIIRFSNDLCYSNTPLIPLRQFGRDRLPPLNRVFVNGGFREGTGNRVVNQPEAQAIADKIVELCADERYAGKTMGVVVLQGEAQADVIEHLLLERLGAEEMERRRLICGNPYSFQGDERDVIFLSLVAAPNEPIGAFTKAADERRFNVAASRARDQIFLFHSVTREELSASCLRRRLLEFFEDTKPREIAGIDVSELERRAKEDNRSVVRAPSPFDSWFEVDIALELSRCGFDVIPQYEVAGKRIDLVVEGGSARLAVECDGDQWHGTDRYEEDTERQRQLERCGWEFVRVRESAFYANSGSALQPVLGGLQQRGILPTRRSVTADLARSLSAVDDAEPEWRQWSELNSSTVIAEHQELPAEREQWANGSERRPLDNISSSDIEQAIVSVLANCPNQSSTMHDMTARVLRELNILTRGSPRAKFERRVMRAVQRLAEQALVETYKAKNARVRLRQETQQNPPRALF